MKKLLTVLVIFMMGISMSLNSSCAKEEEPIVDDPPKKVWTIYVYGSPTCGICSAFKASLDEESIPYTWYDIDSQADKNSEMWAKLNAAGLGGGSVGIPVVDVVVDGVSHVFIRPNRDTDVKPLIED